jgi:hypothetical protein
MPSDLFQLNEATHQNRATRLKCMALMHKLCAFKFLDEIFVFAHKVGAPI